MLKCPYHNPEKCRYPLPCRLEMAMPDDGLFEVIKNFIKLAWDLCEYRDMDERRLKVKEGTWKVGVN